MKTYVSDVKPFDFNTTTTHDNIEVFYTHNNEKFKVVIPHPELDVGVNTIETSLFRAILGLAVAAGFEPQKVENGQENT